MSQTQLLTFGLSTNSVSTDSLTLPHRWSTSTTPLTPYQSHVLDSLRRQLDHRPPNPNPPLPHDNTAREVFELQYLGLVDVLDIQPPHQTEGNWRIDITVRLTLEGFLFISISFIVQRLLEYINPQPTLHSSIRHVADHTLTGQVTQVYQSGKLRIRWDAHTYYPNKENDLDPQFVERY